MFRKELDEATGMYYYGARYYDPRLSFFISVNPLAEHTMESYLYTGNNPIMFTDPTGMSKFPKYAYLAVSLGNTLPNGNFKFRADNIAHFRKFVKPVYSHSGGIKNLLDIVSNSVGYSQTSGLVDLMRSKSIRTDKLYNKPDKEIMFMAVFLMEHEIFGEMEMI